jgi:predicted PurR-regulated permease PerM
MIVLVLSGTGFLFVIGAGSAVREIKELGSMLASQDHWNLPVWLQDRSSQFSFIGRLPPPSVMFSAITGDQGQQVLPAIIGFSRGIFGLVSAAFVILFLALYWSLNQVHFERLWLSLLPPGYRNRTRSIWQTIEADLGAYIRSQILQSILAGMLLGLGYWALGSPYPTLLGIAGAVAYLIPMVGVGLAVLLPLIIGLLTGVQLALLTTLYTLAVLFILEVWIKPRFSNYRQYNPIVTVVILIALARAFGFIGIIVAPPLSAAIQIAWSHLVMTRTTSGSASFQITDLKARHNLHCEAILVRAEPPPPLVTSSLERLARLIEQAEPILQKEFPK